MTLTVLQQVPNLSVTSSETGKAICGHYLTQFQWHQESGVHGAVYSTNLGNGREKRRPEILGAFFLCFSYSTPLSLDFV